MNSTELLINPRTRLMRSGWRAAIFIFLLNLPYLIFNMFLKSPETGNSAGIDLSFEMIFTYVISITWVVAVSWFCLKFLERMKLSALGFPLHRDWAADVLKGCLIAASMILSIVLLQIIGGGSRLSFNPVWFTGHGIDWIGVGDITKQIVGAIVLLILAGAFEELVFRGYAFQTLLRGAPAYVPILIFSIFFGVAHWGNQGRTLFSTANTVLAGVWLSIAYLRTRSLWFPTALHFTWNWTMGAFFGIPVSGLRIPQQTLLRTSSGDPVWLTGGNYGSEGGVAATVVLIIAILVIWRAKWLSVSPEMNAALFERAPATETSISLGLIDGDQR